MEGYVTTNTDIYANTGYGANQPQQTQDIKTVTYYYDKNDCLCQQEQAVKLCVLTYDGITGQEIATAWKDIGPKRNRLNLIGFFKDYFISTDKAATKFAEANDSLHAALFFLRFIFANLLAQLPLVLIGPSGSVLTIAVAFSLMFSFAFALFPVFFNTIIALINKKKINLRQSLYEAIYHTPSTSTMLIFSAVVGVISVFNITSHGTYAIFSGDIKYILNKVLVWGVCLLISMIVYSVSFMDYCVKRVNVNDAGEYVALDSWKKVVIGVMATLFMFVIALIFGIEVKLMAGAVKEAMMNAIASSLGSLF